MLRRARVLSEVHDLSHIFRIDDFDFQFAAGTLATFALELLLAYVLARNGSPLTIG